MLAIGLGSNLGDRLRKIHEAQHALEQCLAFDDVSHSQIYESKAWGKTDEPDYLNAVSVAWSNWPSEEILKSLLSIECMLGRVRQAESRWSARVIDLDFLLYGSKQVNSERLSLPHKYMHQRSFVLKPLSELAGDWVHPVHKLNVDDMLKSLSDQPLDIELYECQSHV